MPLLDATAEDFLIDIAQGKPFSFSRWSDGEWTCLLGKTSPANADGHPYTDTLRDRLEKSLLWMKGSRLGMGAIAKRLYGREIESWLKSRGAAGFGWHDADLFHCHEIEAAKKGRVSSLVKLLRSADVRTIVVGPAPFSSLDEVFPVAKFVPVPSKNCWRTYDDWQEETWDAMAALKPPVFVSVSASMAANVLVHDLCDQSRRAEIKAWVLDLGSIWLNYLPDGHGLKTRTYQRGWKPVLQ